MVRFGIFMADFQRTESSDSLYGVLGRALVVATRFEASVRALSTLLGILADRDVVASPQELERLLEQARKRQLAGSLRDLGFSDADTDMRSAREARNAIAHEAALGLDRCLDALSEPEVASLQAWLRQLAKAVAVGDCIVCTLISVLTHVPVPSAAFHRRYTAAIGDWVSAV